MTVPHDPLPEDRSDAAHARLDARADLRRQRHRSRITATAKALGNEQAEVDPCRHSGGGDEVTVGHDPLAHRGGPVVVQVGASDPMRGGAPPVQQAGAPEQHRAGADARQSPDAPLARTTQRPSSSVSTS